MFPRAESDLADLKGPAAVLEDLRAYLQATRKDEDPRYERVVFAGYEQQGFKIINGSQVRFEGAFPIVMNPGVCTYEGQTIPNIFGSIQKETLVVARSMEIAERWTQELTQLGYTVKRI